MDSAQKLFLGAGTDSAGKLFFFLEQGNKNI